MKIAFLYGGQGSQQVGMGRDLYEDFSPIREFYDSIDLDIPIKDISFYGDERTISRTDITQPLMIAFQVSITKLLFQEGIVPDYVAGLSIGEYSALYASNILNDRDVINIARYRGLVMNQISQKLETKMLAVIGLEYSLVKSICEFVSRGKDRVEISNLNSPGQIIISGSSLAVDRARASLKEQGAKRLIELNVSGPFHTSYMEEASARLGEYFKTVKFNSPNIPIVFNLTGDTDKREDIRTIMSRQVKEPVYFQKSLEYLANREIDIFVEIGFKGVIKGFLRRINKGARVIEINSSQTLDKFLREVADGQYR